MTPTDNPGHIYWRRIAEGERSSLSVLGSFVKAGSRVLDLGVGSGTMGQHLQQTLGCHVDGVTINPDEVKVARSVYQRIELLDLEQPGWESHFEPMGYDAIVCADVLEHLAAPERVLAACRRLLRPDGALLVSIPNAAYAGLIADLMRGNFKYGNEGLMDRTHLRFFTRRSFVELVVAHGWSAETVEAIDQPLHETEFTMAFDALPPAVGNYLLAQPDANAYQLVFVLRPSVLAATSGTSPVSSDVVAASFVTQLFIGFAEGFSADRKITRLGKIGVERQVVTFQIPAALGPWPALRLDPADRPGFFWLHRLTLRDHSSGAVWEWIASEAGARQLAGCARHQLDVGAFDPVGQRVPLLLLGDDPYFELPIDRDSAARCAGQECTLELECGWPMSADYQAAASRFVALELQARGQAERIAALELELAAANRFSAVAVPATPGNESVSAPTRGWKRFLAWGAPPPAAPTPISNASPQTAPDSARFDPVVEIVVPIYGNLELVQRCLASVQSSTTAGIHHLTLINDASSDPEVRIWLHDFAARNPAATVIENARNLGFVQTVNLGMRLAGRRDVVLLNSDTEVANDWLERLRAAAQARDRVGTVTPFSNNATICSYPVFCVDNPLPDGESTASMDRICCAVNRGQAVEIPTAVGFCMYIRRACLDQVGDFDAASFGQGYGEENDFCLRATAAGWRHLHALDVFVYHEGGASFKEHRFALQARALETIRRLHPEYEDLVRAYVQRDPARPFREAIDAARSVRQVSV